MPTINEAACKEATDVLTKLSHAEREYILAQLIKEKLEDREPGEKVSFYAPDGTLCGLFQVLELPSAETLAVMRERAKRVTLGSGRPVGNLLEKLELGDEDEVRKFISN